MKRSIYILISILFLLSIFYVQNSFFSNKLEEKEKTISNLLIEKRELSKRIVEIKESREIVVIEDYKNNIKITKIKEKREESKNIEISKKEEIKESKLIETKKINKKDLAFGFGYSLDLETREIEPQLFFKKNIVWNLGAYTTIQKKQISIGVLYEY